MAKHSFIVSLFLLATSNALACDPAQGTGQCGYQGYGGIYSSYGEAQDSYKQQYGTAYNPPPPPPITVMLPDRFGALAEAHKRAKLYSASDFSSREEAGREAMRLCRNNGNTDCKIIYRVKNGCFAAAEGMTKNGMFRLHFGADTSPSMAEAQAMDVCVSAGMKDCMLAQKAECSIARPPR